MERGSRDTELPSPAVRSVPPLVKLTHAQIAMEWLLRSLAFGRSAMHSPEAWKQSGFQLQSPQE